MKVPLVDLVRQYQQIKNEIDRSIMSVLEGGRFIMGDNVKKFEKEFSRYIGVKHAVSVGSGTDALMLSLKALGIGEGDEVITVSFTFTSSVDCIVHNRALPVFVDIDPETYTIDVTQVERAISKRTKAIMAVHLYGHPVDMGPLLEIAERHNIHLIEDAAQAHGAEYRGRKAGSLGHIACWSFYPTKNLGAYGDAGMITTNDESLSEKLRMLREYGQREKYKHEFVGFNSRLDEIQAAVLRVKLRYLDRWNDQRRTNSRIYTELLSESFLNAEIKCPVERQPSKHVYHLYVIRTKNRDRLRSWLANRGIVTGIHYPVPVHKQKSYNKFSSIKLPISEAYSEEVLSLPMFPELTVPEIEYVCEQIKSFYRTN